MFAQKQNFFTAGLQESLQRNGVYAQLNATKIGEEKKEKNWHHFHASNNMAAGTAHGMFMYMPIDSDIDSICRRSVMCKRISRSSRTEIGNVR